MSHETAFEKPATLGQLKEIVATLVQTVPAELSSDYAQRIIENKGWLVGEVQQLFTLRKLLLEEWVRFYHDEFGLDVHLSTLNIPKPRAGFTRLIVVAKGLTLKRVVKVSRRYYWVDTDPSGRYYYGDEETRGKHDRMPTETYAVWVRDQVDPDMIYKDIPPRMLKERGVHGITLIEYLLLQLKYFKEKRAHGVSEIHAHLDTNGLKTLCLGSRDAFGCIPCAYCGPGGSLYVWYGYTNVSVREVVA